MRLDAGVVVPAMKGMILLFLTIAVQAALGGDLVFYRGFHANTRVPPWEAVLARRVSRHARWQRNTSARPERVCSGSEARRKGF